ncbi:c-type cytochrome [Marinospirillum insulare]|uniref:Cytochrome c n=1 Tax=Marinospirillum insulare TaxID=217169 RepID=A0ABQ6A026_9GAMM|nr:cytochrome c [Marinospirillum insulare]GLR64997.1 cytochrome c [Marinospirillum insulare]
MLKKAIALATLTLLGSTGVQSADLFKPEDAVKYRQAIYQVFSAQAGVMGGMAQGKIDFDAAEINKRATNLGKIAPMLGDTYFPATRDVKESKLKAAAWSNMEDFQSKGQTFGKALGELIEASSKPGFDLKTARPAIGAVLQGCKGCHDDYRAK